MKEAPRHCGGAGVPCRSRDRRHRRHHGSDAYPSEQPVGVLPQSQPLLAREEQCEEVRYKYVYIYKYIFNYVSCHGGSRRTVCLVYSIA